MRVTQRQFVVSFLVAGYLLHFASKFWLDHPPDAMGPSPNQAPWQRIASTILSPVKFVMFSPVNWLLRDPDPPPPLRLLLLTVYWLILAVGAYRALGRRGS